MKNGLTEIMHATPWLMYDGSILAISYSYWIRIKAPVGVRIQFCFHRKILFSST